VNRKTETRAYNDGSSGFVLVLESVHITSDVECAFAIRKGLYRRESCDHYEDDCEEPVR